MEVEDGAPIIVVLEGILGEFPLRPRGGELPGEPLLFLGFLAFLRSSKAKLGVGSGIMVGRG